ncbi:hypothetical protein WMY93_006795 [Mugilogobius chulae]|uniref:Uncharacterized protein n=1 Tax=Mugilogobius chulae TaxID=88201 RepID=A0AAW0PLH8_9GOBI
MSSSVDRSSRESFHCSVCLEVFSEPVTTPCGHNFCKRCICKVWDSDVVYKCPLCKRSYDSRPELSVNTLLQELVSGSNLDKFKSSSKDNIIPTFTEVQCDVCSEPRLQALKSCLVCLSSFCHAHLQPHLTLFELKRHQLLEPVEDMKVWTCPKHQRPLELFCGSDRTLVCMMCSVLEHDKHELLSLQEASERSRSSLLQTQAQTELMVEQRRLKLQQIQRCVQLSQREAHRETQAMVQAFTAVVESVQSCLDRCTAVIEQTQKKHKKQAEVLIQQLEQEICELQKSSSEAEERLSRSQDPLHFLQRCPALTPPAGLKDWSSVSFEPETCEGSAAGAIKQLEKSLSDEFKHLYEELNRAALRRLQSFEVDLTLDPDSAHPELVLSEDLKQVHHSDVKQQLPDSPLRFDRCVGVLGKQSFSSGRFYFEVQVKDKTAWDLGVAQESVNRKGSIIWSPKNKFWCIWLRNRSEYRALSNPDVLLSPRRAPQKVGVFVDYDQGLVSFYDADSADLLYSFTGCRFKQVKLFPYFNPGPNEGGSNSAPLVLTPAESGAAAVRRLELNGETSGSEVTRDGSARVWSCSSETSGSEVTRDGSARVWSCSSETSGSEVTRDGSARVWSCSAVKVLFVSGPAAVKVLFVSGPAAVKVLFVSGAAAVTRDGSAALVLTLVESGAAGQF